MGEGLSEGQADLFWRVLSMVAGYSADPLLKLADLDLAEAAASVAATLETADRGVIYEHRPPSLPAQRLANEIKGVLSSAKERLEGTGAARAERDAVVVLRRD